MDFTKFKTSASMTALAAAVASSAVSMNASALTTSEEVQQLYIAYLGRPADKPGLDYWTTEIDGGILSLEQLRANLVNEQPEYLENYGQLGTVELVETIYQNLFNRTFDEAGRDYWVGQVEQGLVLPDDLLLAFINGAFPDDQTVVANKVLVAECFTQSTADYTDSEVELLLASQGPSVTLADCPDTSVEGTAAYVARNNELKGDFSENVALLAGGLYSIDGEVNFLDGAQLTIPAGTTLFGETGSSYLAINRGAKIYANGTADEPVTFTSALDVAGQAEQNDQGQWGGLTILGKSTNNKGERTYEAGTQLYGPVDGVADPADGSGELEYVIIKYSGFEVEVDKELNGLSLGSVGSGTKIENIAIIGSADDGIELWGGTVNVTNLYVYNAGDDSIDTDQGYVGTIDNVYVQQVVVDDETDSRGIEADSFDTTSAGDPVAVPTLRNATLDTIGRAIRLREGTGYIFDNVQVNVKSSSADPESDSYFADVAAIRISDDVTFNTALIQTEGGGIGINNEAVSYSVSDSAAGDITANGEVATGLGLYRDADTKAYFDGLSDVHATVGVSGDDVDEGFLDSDGSPFMAEVAADNIITGADVSVFDWAIEGVQDKETVVVQGDITTDTTWSASNLYALNGEVNVIAPATLTIEAGTTIFGVTGSSYLAINRGAMIMADGTAANPIVFTSAQDIAGLNTGEEQGQWGGLTILGQSTNNRGERTYEAGTQLYGPADGVTIEDDNSGILRYVVVKYTGFEVEKDKELNGISLGSVGSGTIIENVASIGSADDGIEMWGGTVNVNGLYVYNAGDDSLDTDQGYTGTMSNVYAEQSVVDDEVDSRVIEADGLNSTDGGDPQSKPVLIDAILKAKGRAIRLREGTGYVFNNVQVTVLDTTVDATADAIRISDDITFTLAGIETAGAGIAIKNNADAAALYRDDATEAYFDTLTNVFEDDDTSLSITEYDRSWIPGWTK